MCADRFNPAKNSILAISIALMCLTPASSEGQEKIEIPSNPDQQFHFERSGKGFVRLNNKTGETSFCRQVLDDIVCSLGVEERDALHSEIVELQNIIAALKGKLDQIQGDSPQILRPENKVPDPKFREGGGSGRDKIEKEVDRAIDIARQTMRMLFKAVKELQREFARESFD